MKVDDAIGKLHFDSVRQALAGVEAVLKEFPPAMRYLKEFGLLNESIMTTERGNGKINFNPEYFNNVEKLTATLAAGVRSGFYPKNMTIFGAGAHEAGHIVEDWLLAKYGVDNVSSRIVPQKVVLEAYMEVMRRLARAGEFKSLQQLKIEIAGYAIKNDSECMALGISDYETNEISSANLSIEIWRRLKKELS